MLKKNLALSVVYALTLAGLTACGGGSDSGTEAPVAVPPPTPTPEDVLPEFASATYVRENSEGLAEVVLLGDDLYYVSFSGEGNLLSRFTQISEHIADGEIADAAGFYKLADDTELKAGQFSASLTINSSNVVNSMTGLTLESTGGAGNQVVIAGGTFNKVTNIADISALNDDWSAEADFSEFSIDTGLNLTAVDNNNCNISATLTAQDNDVFAATFNYADCDAAGQYEGVLWSYSFDGVTYLKWFALDSDNKAVTGAVDDFTSQQDALALNGELQPALYVGGMPGRSLISKGNKVYYRGGDIGGNYVFSYTAPETVAVLEAEGEGLDWPLNNAVAATLVMPVPNSKSHELSGEILLSDDADTFSGMEQVAQTSLLTSVTGHWSDMTIAENGTVSGTLLDCTITTGTVTNYEASIADMQLSLTGCDIAGDFTGVAVAIKQSAGDIILLNIFRLGVDNSVANIGGTLSATKR
jgi:hypothetical protein